MRRRRRGRYESEAGALRIRGVVCYESGAACRGSGAACYESGAASYESGATRRIRIGIDLDAGTLLALAWCHNGMSGLHSG